MKSKTSVILSLILAAAVSPAFAHEGMGGDEAHKGQWMQQMKQKLGLTDDQQQKMEAEMKRHGEAEKPLRQTMRDQMKKLADQVKAKDTSDADIETTLDAIKSTHQSMEQEEQAFHDAMGKILTPRQKASMLLWHMSHMRHEGMKGHPGMKGGHQAAGGKDSDDDEKEEDGD